MKNTALTLTLLLLPVATTFQIVSPPFSVPATPSLSITSRSLPRLSHRFFRSAVTSPPSSSSSSSSFPSSLALHSAPPSRFFLSENLAPAHAALHEPAAIASFLPSLKELLSTTPSLSLYSIDLLAGCEYLPQEMEECSSATCELYPLDIDVEEEYPEVVNADRADFDFRLDGWARMDMPTEDYYSIQQVRSGGVHSGGVHEKDRRRAAGGCRGHACGGTVRVCGSRNSRQMANIKKVLAKEEEKECCRQRATNMCRALVSTLPHSIHCVPLENNDSCLVDVESSFSSLSPLFYFSSPLHFPFTSLYLRLFLFLSLHM